jgi:hypothetical protein
MEYAVKCDDLPYVKRILNFNEMPPSQTEMSILSFFLKNATQSGMENIETSEMYNLLLPHHIDSPTEPQDVCVILTLMGSHCNASNETN